MSEQASSEPRLDIVSAGEDAFIVYFGDTPDAALSARVHAATEALRDALGKDLIDLIPSYASILVIYNMLRCDHLSAQQRARVALEQFEEQATSDSRLVTLPVYYGSDVGPELESIARQSAMTADEVIALHSGTEYRVYAIGFAPGFAYLGQVDKRIAAPRLATPRQSVPRGAVAIADQQTAVYPAVSPGGWNLIGRCPVRMFDPSAEPTMPVSVGDRVCFTPITRDEFLAQGGEL